MKPDAPKREWPCNLDGRKRQGMTLTWRAVGTGNTRS
ncbi:hypothetical protein C7441_109144 [Pseudaminobacter salicylatoxidans]|uniref:Uncharacterized protein n=1 Tax=Pseudaminobacter salicylatoxidans TaxID=93369 RepID=A0A316C1H1_PSESE|nr:hypothetical protein C7441_109144 [Pseudaminobacter salicylatoxidans]